MVLPTFFFLNYYKSLEGGKIIPSYKSFEKKIVSNYMSFNNTNKHLIIF
jgi:hypothetical protein